VLSTSKMAVLNNSIIVNFIVLVVVFAMCIYCIYGVCYIFFWFSCGLFIIIFQDFLCSDVP
jgi:hypothetical protein